jgi:hypothetical protein
VAVRDVGELVREAFSEEAIVRASFLNGFYGPPITNLDGDAPIEAAAGFLARDNEKRFWSALARDLLAGRKDEASRLLTELTGFHIRRRSYPHAFGSRLLQTVLSLPPGTRRKMSDGPIMGMGDCIQISQFAVKGDHEDVGLLFKAVSVETWKGSGGSHPS